MSQDREVTDFDLFLEVARLNEWVSSLGDRAQELPVIQLLKDRLTDGKYREQSVPAYLLELQAYTHTAKHVLGRLQEERQPGNDPGDDEDGPRGEDERSRLRSGGEVQIQYHGIRRMLTSLQTIQDDGSRSQQVTEGSEGVFGQPTR